MTHPPPQQPDDDPQREPWLDQQEKSRTTYNRMSRVYGWLSDASEREFVEQAVAGLLRPQPGDWILEPGFGTGQVLLALAEAVGPEGHVAGIDISDGMLKRAQERLEKHALAQRADVRRGSATDLPWDAATFDGVFMSFTLELFPDDQIPAVLTEVHRVLKGSGRLCVACMSDQGPDNTMEHLYRWSHRHFPNAVDCRPIDAPRRLRDAGFTVTATRRLSMWGLAVDLVLAEP